MSFFIFLSFFYQLKALFSDKYSKFAHEKITISNIKTNVNAVLTAIELIWFENERTNFMNTFQIPIGKKTMIVRLNASIIRVS